MILEQGKMMKLILLGLFGFIAMIAGCMAIVPTYSVYHQKMAGEAELARATQNRQIVVLQAKAEQEAEILRAEGTARANKIIGDSLKGNEDYLRWLWISKLDNQSNKTVVYVPTDGMVPTLETGRIGSNK